MYQAKAILHLLLLTKQQGLSDTIELISIDQDWSPIAKRKKKQEENPSTTISEETSHFLVLNVYNGGFILCRMNGTKLQFSEGNCNKLIETFRNDISSCHFDPLPDHTQTGNHLPGTMETVSFSQDTTLTYSWTAEGMRHLNTATLPRMERWSATRTV